MSLPPVSRGTTGPATDRSGGERGKLGEGGETISASGQAKDVIYSRPRITSHAAQRSGNSWTTLYYRPLHISHHPIQHV